MAQKVAMDIPDGAYVNLGIGIPEMVAGFIPEGREVIYHTENGLLGMGKVAERGAEDYELVNAGKKYVTAIPGSSLFPSCRQLCHDPRRAYRYLCARCLAGFKRRRSGQLVNR